MIKTTNKLDIFTAVNKASDDIRLGCIGFFVDTEFGYIPIEVIHRKPEMSSIEVRPWKEAPATSWVIENRNGLYEWYVQINYIRGQDPVLTRRQLIGAFIAIMFKSLGGIWLETVELNMMISAYIKSFNLNSNDNKPWVYAEKYAKTCGGFGTMFSFNSKMRLIKEVENHLKTMEELNKVTKNKYRDKLASAVYYKNAFGNTFYDLMFALIAKWTPEEKTRYTDLTTSDLDITSYLLLKKIFKNTNDK